MNKKVLILSPHADDEILGCGGFISKYSKQKYLINVLILTNANKGAPEVYSSKEINQIRNESKKKGRAEHSFPRSILCGRTACLKALFFLKKSSRRVVFL